MINIFFSFMGSGILRPLPTSYVEQGGGVPGFSLKYRKYGLPYRPYQPEDRRRNRIPCLNSPLPNLKLVLPYGEYRATYAKAV